MLKEGVCNKTDILLISETKLDDTFPLHQFILEGFTPAYRLHRTMHGGGLMLFVREDIPSKLLPNIDPSNNIFVEINLRLFLGGLFQTPIILMLVLFKIAQSI